MSGIVHALTSATTAERRNADEALGRAIRVTVYLVGEPS